MCGIFGVVSASGITSQERSTFSRLSAALIHRGPDGSATIDDPNALLGMHRLSIMDVAGGNQPFWSEDGSYGVLGNGEIYNAPSLRQQLTDRGHLFNSHSDIEVIPHLFEEFGLEAFKKLRGMFALIVIDSRRRAVHLVRDRLGEKPLSYARLGRALWFSSELTPLVKAEVLAPTLDLRGISAYLQYGFVPETTSIIVGAEKVRPGSVLSIALDSGAVTSMRYWDPLEHVGQRNLDPTDVAGAIEDAVIVCCQSDVPIAISLSGGLDSSLVAALAKRARGDLHALTVGYANAPSSDETALAIDFAKTIDLDVTRVVLQTEDVAAGFGHVCANRDEPVADLAGISYDALARVARQEGFPVLLNGQGGDAVLLGVPMGSESGPICLPGGGWNWFITPPRRSAESVPPNNGRVGFVRRDARRSTNRL